VRWFEASLVGYREQGLDSESLEGGLVIVVNALLLGKLVKEQTGTPFGVPSFCFSSRSVTI